MHSNPYAPAHPYSQVYFARFSDGKSAASTDAKVRLTDRGITIELPDRHAPLTWPYGALASAEPLSQKAIDALLTYSHQPGASLFVSDATFARTLATTAPHLSASAQRWRHARPFVWVAAGIMAIWAVVWMGNLSPTRAIAELLPDKARTALGQQAIQSMTEGKRVCTAPKGVAALDRLTDKLSKAAGGRRTFKVVVVDWDVLNAFATPGEQIVMSRGLLAKANGPDEIAGVLGHEMGHGLEMHPETGIIRAVGLSAAIELMMGGSGGTLGNIGVLLAQLSYSREAEREADGHALKLLREASISPRGLAEFFDRVMRLEGGPDADKKPGNFTILRSHPLTQERRKMVDDQPAYSAIPSLSVEDWEALQNICRAPAAPGAGARDI